MLYICKVLTYVSSTSLHFFVTFCVPFLLFVSLLIIESLSYAHSHQFKAKPFNRDIINKDGLQGVPLKRTFELTHPMTPDFTSKK